MWLGCHRTATWGVSGALAREAAEHIDAHATESPYLSPVHYAEKRSEAEDAAARETRLRLPCVTAMSTVRLTSERDNGE